MKACGAPRRDGRCRVCGTVVEAYTGLLLLEQDQGKKSWSVVCSSNLCQAELGLGTRPAKRLLADGRVVHPKPLPSQLDLLRAFPPPAGQRSGWDREERCWRVSTAPADKRRVLELAAKLGLDVDPAWHQASEAEADAAVRLDYLTEQSVAEPYDYQRLGMEWLSLRERALLGDDMGLGKTMQVLWSLPLRAARCVVVCPASLKFVWETEARKWRGDLRVTVLSGRSSFRPPEEGEIVVTNYDILPPSRPAPPPEDKRATKEERKRRLDEWREKEKKWKEKWEKKTDLRGCVLVADEATMLKSGRAQRKASFRALTPGARVWLLTGTPLLNRPLDLWGVLQAGGMGSDVFGSWMGFTRCFQGSKNRWGGWEFEGPLPEVPERLRRVMLRRRKDEVLEELPPVQLRELTVNGLDDELQMRLDDAWEDWEDRGSLPDFREYSELRRDLAVSRIPQLLELVEQYEEAGEPLVVFSAHRGPIEELSRREGWETILGGTPDADRKAAVEAFQAGRLKGIALTIRAGGYGLTLTRASHVLFVDLSWVPGENAQATDRLRRIGQEAASITCTVMVSRHPLDQHVLRLIADKELLISAAVDAKVEVEQPPEAPPTDTLEAQEARKRAYEVEQEKQREAERKAAKDASRVRTAEILAGERRRMAPKREITLTPEIKTVLEGAYEYLQGRCDGAREKDHMGFNKPDAARAHAVMEFARELDADGDDSGYRALALMLARYKRQLSAEFPALWGRRDRA